MTGDQAPKTILLASPRGFCEEVFFPLPPEVARVREAARSALARS
jgi:hypothetical protein